MHVSLRIFIVFLFFSSGLSAQTWRSELYPTNWTPKGDFYTDKIIQDFSYAGYWRKEKEIPFRTANIKDVTKAPYLADKTGTNDATAAIQSAINDVQSAGGGVVYLPAGTYKISPGTRNFCLQINKSNVVLRGDGTGKTFLMNSSYQMNFKNILSISGSPNWYNDNNPSSKITKDLKGPVFVIPVQSASLFKVGDLVCLRNKIGDAWINEHKISAWMGYGANLRGIAFCREVMAVNLTNNTITIDAPIRYSLLMRDNSAVYKLSGTISEVGIEQLSIGNVKNPSTTGYGEEAYKTAGTPAFNCHGASAIYINGVVNCWINYVNTYSPPANKNTAHILSNGIVLSQSKNVSILNCHFQKPQYGGGGGNGYMYRISGSENLVANCIAEFNRHGFVFTSMLSSGNVIHRCTDKNTGRATGGGESYNTSGSGSDHHMHFSTSNLIDQCTTENSFFAAGYRTFGSKPIHGITGAHTVYWNLKGTGTRFNYVVHTQQARYGYAIGTSGNASAVRSGIFSGTNSDLITAPLDHVERPGQGETLEPQSLYLDQVSKRVNSSNPCSGNTAPSITLASSVTSALAPASFVLTATAEDIKGSISKVEFYNGTALVKTVLAAPFTYSATNVATGAYTYTAKATDNCGVSTISAPVKVTVSTKVNLSPSVSLLAPLNGASYKAPASILLQADAKDDDGSISKVEFYNGTQLINIDATLPYEYTYSITTAGTYTLLAKAYDNVGAIKNSQSVSITVTSNSTLPGISGVSCMNAGSTSVFTVTTEANANNASWWCNGNATVTVDPANFRKATMKLNGASGSIVITCGVNYSTYPYFKEYTRTIKIDGCGAKATDIVIAPYPAEETNTISSESGILEIILMNTSGQVISKHPYQGEKEIEFAPELPAGNYLLQVITDGGSVTKPYIKVR
ncbi:MAG: Ig-like domain-containing protein [Cytophagaceae bacterium]|jgi:hypothetical protein|nr:Ig-like domain-containing protein [Cytophagaceae bacterium]